MDTFSTIALKILDFEVIEGMRRVPVDDGHSRCDQCCRDRSGGDVPGQPSPSVLLIGDGALTVGMVQYGGCHFWNMGGMVVMPSFDCCYGTIPLQISSPHAPNVALAL